MVPYQVNHRVPLPRVRPHLMAHHPQGLQLDLGNPRPRREGHQTPEPLERIPAREAREPRGGATRPAGQFPALGKLREVKERAALEQEEEEEPSLGFPAVLVRVRSIEIWGWSDQAGEANQMEVVRPRKNRLAGIPLALLVICFYPCRKG